MRSPTVTVRIITAGALMTLLGTCTGVDPPASYFPLQTGAVWRYQQVLAWGDRQERQAYWVENVATGRLGGSEATIRRNNLGTEYYIADRPEGVARIGKRSIVETSPRADRPPRFVIKRPYRRGTEWRQLSHPYLLRRILPFHERFNRAISFTMNYAVSGTQETVTVPAGRFERCLLVEGSGVIKIHADAVAGVSEVPVRTREWYAPGVGLVLLEREEELHTTQIIGGTARLELLEYRP